jgi:hypothetical protein
MAGHLQELTEISVILNLETESVRCRRFLNDPGVGSGECIQYSQ